MFVPSREESDLLKGHIRRMELKGWHTDESQWMYESMVQAVCFGLSSADNRDGLGPFLVDWAQKWAQAIELKERTGA